jgi:nucleoside-diphosphate-sugar epimerase
VNTLIVGASGATGKRLVEQLLGMGHHVRAIVRVSAKLPDSWNKRENLTIIRASVSEMTVDEMMRHVRDCRAVASCLGHNLTLKGILGKPRRFVADTVLLICDAIGQNAPGEPVRFVLMNTAGIPNSEAGETVSTGERLVTGLLHVLLPPHADNEQAADHLRLHIGTNNPSVEWVVVRPDTLIDQENVTGYNIHASPVRSALFDPGKTSRINVAHFMARLMNGEELWEAWKGQMPVIYNE